MKEFFYKYGLVMFLILSICILGIQKELEISEIIQKASEVSKDVPKEAVVMMALTPAGPFPVVLRKGLLNPSNEGERWITLKEFKERLGAYEQVPETNKDPMLKAEEGEDNAIYKKGRKS